MVTAVDPDGPAAEHGLQKGNVILDVGGKAVANAGDVRKALTEAKAQGKHDVLMRVKIGDATRSSLCRSAMPESSGRLRQSCRRLQARN